MHRSRMQADAIADDLWQRVSEFVARTTGLHFPAERRPDLQRGLTAAAAEFGFTDGAGCANWLLSTPLTRPQLHALVSHLTVGETYFFREPKAFDALRGSILPELLRRRRGREQRLRLWSAACSTGEEAYSLAILVQQLLPDWQDWEVTILATDINEHSLQKAVAGVYGEWSFRESSSEFKERYFTRGANGRFTIAPEIRQCVHFAHMNLAQDGFSSATINTGSMDVIFCRNLLIYFTAAHARQLVENLRRSLLDEGWLVVSPSECSQALFSQFAAVNFPGSILYRKGNPQEGSASNWAPPAESAATAFAPPQASVAPFASTLAPEMRPAVPEMLHAAPEVHPAVPEQVLPAGTESSQTFSLQARTLANQGRHAEALVWCERWIAADKIDAAAHYVHATVLQEMGQREAARRSLQRAVYLQPGFALAHFVLGNFARAAARPAEADRHFANALHVLRDSPPDALLPESDGLTAGRLVEIITTLLAQPDRAGHAGGAPA
jgi:chemotaxis protein methyltransferase CheR